MRGSKMEKIRPADVLIVAPHADDAEFGIAESVAKWTKAGKQVVYVICSNGEKGTSDPSITEEMLTEIRRREQFEAAKVLGVREVIFLGYPDQGIEDTPEFRKNIVKQIRTFQPYLVATTDPYRKYLWHRDHRMTGVTTLDAIYPFARDHLAYPDLYKEGYLPHKGKEVWTWGTDEPNYWSNVTDTWKTKIAALRCHKSQVEKNLDQVREWVTERAVAMAAGKDYKYAEAFHRIEIWR
jgi:LmbE family N-acetylglucosaminyl deacetylase